MRHAWWAGVAALSIGIPALGRAQQPAVSGQEIFSSSAHASLRRSAETWASRGYALRGEPSFGVLADRERDSLTISTEPGKQYVIQGMCDDDCGALDFYLFNRADSLVGSYAQSDGHPYVQLIRPDSTAFRLEVLMSRCSVPPCYYGIQVLERKTQEPKD